MSRQHWGFASAVRKSFSFLEAQGFQCVREEAALVRYESARLFVEIHLDATSCEIGFDIGRIGSRECYGLEAVISLVDEEAARQYRIPAGRGRDVVTRLVAGVASVFREYGKAVLVANDTAFARMAKWRDDESRALELDVSALQSRRLAESAFRRGDFAEVVRSYERIKQLLTPAEGKKLAYARRRAQIGDSERPQ